MKHMTEYIALNCQMLNIEVNKLCKHYTLLLVTGA